MKQYLIGEPFERVQTDIFGPMPKSDSGNRYILTINVRLFYEMDSWLVGWVFV